MKKVILWAAVLIVLAGCGDSWKNYRAGQLEKEKNKYEYMRKKYGLGVVEINLQVSSANYDGRKDNYEETRFVIKDNEIVQYVNRVVSPGGSTVYLEKNYVKEGADLRDVQEIFDPDNKLGKKEKMSEGIYASLNRRLKTIIFELENTKKDFVF